MLGKRLSFSNNGGVVYRRPALVVITIIKCEQNLQKPQHLKVHESEQKACRNYRGSSYWMRETYCLSSKFVCFSPWGHSPAWRLDLRAETCSGIELGSQRTGQDLPEQLGFEKGSQRKGQSHGEEGAYDFNTMFPPVALWHLNPLCVRF